MHSKGRSFLYYLRNDHTSYKSGLHVPTGGVEPLGSMSGSNISLLESHLCNSPATHNEKLTIIYRRFNCHPCQRNRTILPPYKKLITWWIATNIGWIRWELTQIPLFENKRKRNISVPRRKWRGQRRPQNPRRRHSRRLGWGRAFLGRSCSASRTPHYWTGNSTCRKNLKEGKKPWMNWRIRK